MKIPNPFSKKPKPQDPPPSEPVLPGDLPEYFDAGRKVKAAEIRHLTELFRRRYELDLQIWRLRDSQPRDRSNVMDIMRRSDATLQKIRRTVQAWDRRDIFDSDGDWDKFKEIQLRLATGEKRVWARDPPWKDLENM
ncbi:MAG: hypothetical protein M1839_001995 [Geoglossum umbratile]|nr:MAG: hypothetical protein M1839_001995 [Geoglossum umbratile]